MNFMKLILNIYGHSEIMHVKFYRSVVLSECHQL